MKLGYIGLPWAVVGIIQSTIASLISYGFYQLGVFVSVTYPSLWIIPILCNIAMFIAGIYAVVFLGIALTGLVFFVSSLFKK